MSDSTPALARDARETLIDRYAEIIARTAGDWREGFKPPLYCENAARRIVNDRADASGNDELVAALDPWARVALLNMPLSAGWADDRPAITCIPGAWPTWGDLKRAAAAIARTQEQSDG